MHLGALLATLCITGILTSGCIAEQPSQGPTVTYDQWESDPCDPSGAATVAQNAPALEPWQESPYQIAKRLADAIGDPIQSPVPSRTEDDFTEWTTDKGTIRHRADEDEPPHLYYTTQRVWPSTDADEAEDAFRQMLRGFGVPDDIPYSYQDHDWRTQDKASATARLTFDGRFVERTGSSFTAGENSGSPTGRFSSLTILQWHDLRAAEIRVDEAAMRSTAIEYDRCVMDREGKTAEAGYVQKDARLVGYRVLGTSLTRGISVTYTEPGEPGHCGFGHWVWVDIETGAVHGWDWPPCD